MTNIDPEIAKWLEENYDLLYAWVTFREEQREDLIRELEEGGIASDQLISLNEFQKRIADL